MGQDLLEQVIANRPKAHQGDAEVAGTKALEGSSLSAYMGEVLEKNLVVCHGIDPEVARFLHLSIVEGGQPWRPDPDFVFIDGKHAVPWPFIDWFYTAEKLQVGGVCLIDDIHLESVLDLVKFLQEEPRWESVWELPRRTIAFRKLSTTVHDVAWHQQPYISRRYGRKGRTLNALGIKWRPKPKE